MREPCSAVPRLWSQGGHRGFRDGSPPAESSRVWRRSTRSQIQTICSCQMLFYAGLLPSPSSISPLPLPTPSKNAGSARIPWPNTVGAKRARADPWLRCYSNHVWWNTKYTRCELIQLTRTRTTEFRQNGKVYPFPPITFPSFLLSPPLSIPTSSLSFPSYPPLLSPVLGQSFNGQGSDGITSK